MEGETSHLGAYSFDGAITCRSKVRDVEGVEVRGIVCDFVFVRHWARYVVTTFLPLWLVSCLSYLGTWVNPDSDPARTAIAVTSVLVLMTLMISVGATLPDELSKVVALDLYFLVCLSFVCLNALEY
eukprot:gene43820-10453_t